MPQQTSSPVLADPTLLAPDLVAMSANAAPHPDLGLCDPLATVAGLAAAARFAASILGEQVTLTSPDGRVAVAGAPDLAPGQVRIIAAKRGGEQAGGHPYAQPDGRPDAQPTGRSARHGAGSSSGRRDR